MKIINADQFIKGESIVFINNDKAIAEYLDANQTDFLKKQQSDKKELITINNLSDLMFTLNPKISDNNSLDLEKYRKFGFQIFQAINAEKKESLFIDSKNFNTDHLLALIEGLILSSYTFNKYHSDIERNLNYLKTIRIKGNIRQKELTELNSVCQAVSFARDLVNEPVSYLTAEQLGDLIKLSSKNYGFSSVILEKKQIEALKMGGLLAVNKGSFDPPTFSIMEWKPENPKNNKPIVIVGKGVTFDTGGLSLKPTAGSMDEMKSDMAGAAAVVGLMQAIAANRLNVHVVGLVPATDNRPGNRAYAPQDIITMYDGTKVEVLNTDAEGRMILADALSYAKKYQPELVIDLATLTGAAHAAIGPYGIVAMGNADESMKNKLKTSGEKVHERLVEFPFWDEYGELIKSDIADIKNIGGKIGGAITAGKFLEHFTDYPYIHLDIAGPAYINSRDGYKTQGGTGVGVRLLYDFFKNY
ncbi:MAG: leucyl aminopeptidase [Bacteroidales bacterium]|nr:leucyl aminopeptidase [Bacteroidales bacterium]